MASLKQNKKTSLVWKYFSDVVDDIYHVTCNLCSKKVSRGGANPKNFNTSIMKNHLQSKHLGEYKKIVHSQSDLSKPWKEISRHIPQGTVGNHSELNIDVVDLGLDVEIETNQTIPTSSVKQCEITHNETVDRKRKFDNNHPVAKELTKRICESIAVDIQPISITEDMGFKRIMKYAMPNYVIPSKQYFIDTAIPDIYKKAFDKVKLDMSEASYISLTSDIWTATINNTPFISLTGHWLDENFNQHRAVLKVMPFEGEHSGEKIGIYISQGLEHFEIPTHKLHLLLRDNAANMVKGVRQCGIESLGCFIYTLQLCIHDSIMAQYSVIEILAICRKSARYFNRSPLGLSKFKEYQERLGTPKHQLIQDSSARWNWKYYMLERYYEQRLPLALFSMECEDDNVKNLSNSQWDLIKKLVDLLKPFEEIAKKISLRTTTTSSIIPTILTLKIILKNAENSLSGIKSMMTELRKSVETRFDCLLGDETLCLSTFLDPRYKLVIQANELEKSNVIEWMYKAMNNETEEGGKDNNHFVGFTHSTQSLNLDNCFEMLLKEKVSGGIEREQIFEEVSNACYESQLNIALSQRCLSKKVTKKQIKLKSSLEEEVDKYLNLPLIDKNSDPFSYWKANKISLPLLQKLALKYLSAPATSVDSERFLSTEDIFESTRNRLSPELAEMIMFLHYNLRIYNFNYE